MPEVSQAQVIQVIVLLSLKQKNGQKSTFYLDFWFAFVSFLVVTTASIQEQEESWLSKSCKSIIKHIETTHKE